MIQGSQQRAGKNQEADRNAHLAVKWNHLPTSNHGQASRIPRQRSALNIDGIDPRRLQFRTGVLTAMTKAANEIHRRFGHLLLRDPKLLRIKALQGYVARKRDMHFLKFSRSADID